MAITGAIFDCDATLLDSVPMWQEIVPRTFSRYTDADLEAHIQQTITMPLDDAMRFFIDTFHPDVSLEELSKTIKAEVRRGYAENCPVYPDMLALIQELKQKGIPMAVASCTSKNELEHGLKAQKLYDYFDYVFSAADGYPGKERPDVFLAAQKALNTPLQTTWVFEDSLVAAKTAREAGFAVAGLIRKNNWHDTSRLREIASIARSEDEPWITYADLVAYER